MNPVQPSILFVDDEPAVLDGIRRMLRHKASEWRLRFANSVDEAIESALAESPDLVVSDVTMPRRDGFDLLASFQADPFLRPIPVIILTGLGDAQLKRRALDAGAVDLLTKPVDLEDLRARIASALRIKEYEDSLRSNASALERAVEARTLELRSSHLELIFRLAMAGEYRDTDTGRHVVRVAHLSRAMSELLGLEPEHCERIFIGSPLHDIGKIGLPDGILRKPGALTPEERREMQKHCEIGHRILSGDSLSTLLGPEYFDSVGRCAASSNQWLATAGTIALCHHERWDGTGYPRGLAGEDIPIEARIVALADVIDALSSVRPYKPAIPLATVREMVREAEGSHFDPQVLRVAEKNWDTLCQICTRLADDRAGDLPAASAA